MIRREIKKKRLACRSIYRPTLRSSWWRRRVRWLSASRLEGKRWACTKEYQTRYNRWNWRGTTIKSS